MMRVPQFCCHAVVSSLPLELCPVILSLHLGQPTRQFRKCNLLRDKMTSDTVIREYGQ